MKTFKNCLCAAVCAVLCVALLASCGGDAAKDDAAAFDYSAGFNADGTWKDINPADYVELADYAALTLPADVTTVDPDEIQSYLDDIVAGYGEKVQVTDRTVQQGDTVNIDYVGTMDGEAFEGGDTNGTGTTVTIGVTNYIDDFLDQLVGHKPGDTVNVEVTFPDDYGVENLNGKDALFVTKINYIEETVAPELTDAFVAENLSAAIGVNTVAELRQAVSEELLKKAVLTYVRQWLVDNSTVSEIPEEVMAFEEGALLESYRLYAEQYNLTLDAFLTTYFGTDSAGLLEQEKQASENNAKYYLVLETVAAAENVTVSDEDIAAFFKLNTGSEDYSEYAEFYGEPYVWWVARASATEDLLVERLLEK